MTRPFNPTVLLDSYRAMGWTWPAIEAELHTFGRSDDEIARIKQAWEAAS